MELFLLRKIFNMPGFVLAKRSRQDPVCIQLNSNKNDFLHCGGDGSTIDGVSRHLKAESLALSLATALVKHFFAQRLVERNGLGHRASEQF